MSNLIVLFVFIPFDAVAMFKTNGDGSATLANTEQCTCFIATIDVVLSRTEYFDRIGPNIETTTDICSLFFAVVANLCKVCECACLRKKEKGD